ncbi:MAG TPA: hypothetical protein VGR10_01000 [Thermoleophilaceae bacterium]|nr:hypothetical protein [Thermoleophilaceae bacterium]
MAKQRQTKMVQQMGSLGAMQQLEHRTDEQLLSESRHRAAARAILGARAAERYDATAARRYFNEALAGSHPRERPALRQMMKASLALAERRPDELKEAVEKMGQAPPSSRQLFMLRLAGLLIPAQGAGALARARGVVLLVLLALVLVAVGYGLAELIFLPLGGIGFLGATLVGIGIVIAVLAVLSLLGRRRQRNAREARAGPG